MKPNQLSNTAAFIAVKFYGLSRDEPFRSLFDADIVRFYEQLVQSLPAPLRYYHSGLKQAGLRRFFTFWEELLLPGDLMHIILRKYYLNRWVEELRQQKYNQLLVLGGGFDHLAALSAAAGMCCLEIDTPKMIHLKQRFVNECDYTHPYLSLREAFFGPDSLQDVLLTNDRLDRDVKTIVVTEGFFDYFTPWESAEILTDLNAFFTGELQLLSTLFSLEELSGFRSLVYKKSIRLAGEELKLGLDREKFISLLKRHQFKCTAVIDKDEMRREVLETRNISYPVLEGFYLLKNKRK